MERRDRSLKALNELTYVDSLEPLDKADALARWYENYLVNDTIENLDLELEDLKRLQELFFKNINFLKAHKEETRLELVKMQKMKRFLKN